MNPKATASAITAVLTIAAAFWLGRAGAPQPDAKLDQSVVATASGANKTTPQKHASKQTRTPQLNPVGDRIAIPSELSLYPGMSVPQAQNWEQLLAALPPEQRDIAEVFRSRYPDAYRFSNPEQLHWMLKHGYPMPEEIAEAELMPRDELIELAKSGNLKAQLLAADIEATDLMRDFDSLTENERAQRTADLHLIQAEAMESCSPFAGYVTMTADRYSSRFYPGQLPYNILGRLSYIESRGDWRVESTMQIAVRELGLPPESLQALSWVGLSYSPLVRQVCQGGTLPR